MRGVLNNLQESDKVTVLNWLGDFVYFGSTVPYITFASSSQLNIAKIATVLEFEIEFDLMQLEVPEW